MKDTLRYFSNVYFYWVSFFVFFRVLFMGYHHELYGRFPFQELIMPLWKGLYMDASMAAYLSILPFLFWTLRPWISGRVFNGILTGYFLVVLVVASLLLIADLEVFANWGHRIDSAILPYLRYPKEAFASASSSPLKLLVVLYVFVVGSFAVFRWWKAKSTPIPDRLPIGFHLSGILFAGLLIIPIRGGLQLAPMNQSSVYFSTERVLNQAAENGVWVFMQSLLESGDESLEKEYASGSQEEADNFLRSLYPPQSSPDSVLRNSRPNIVLIVWESLTAKVVGSLGGQYPSTPNLDRMAKEGILFTNFYASGDRSDKGLAAILASVPALGKMSIMAQPNLTGRLPFLNRSLSRMGYKTTFMYGGELEFANMKSFMLNAGFDKLIGKEDFPPETYNSKWGAHDEVLFARQLKEAGTEKEPFFHTLFTLTSHEPFEVPGVVNKEGESVDSLFCRSHRYTDRCLADWLSKASEQSWWKNTLVIVVADHGHPHPGNSLESDLWKFKIPMVWYGPILAKQGIEISEIGSQTDLFRTLKGQLNDRSAGPDFSRDLLAHPSSPFAFFSFRSGSVFLQGGKSDKVLDPVAGKGAAALYRQSVFTKLYQNNALSGKP